MSENNVTINDNCNLPQPKVMFSNVQQSKDIQFPVMYDKGKHKIDRIWESVTSKYLKMKIT